MTAITINPMVVSVSPTSATPITPIHITQHGGGLKKVLAVVAAVVIPIAAPAIAGAIGLSGAIATAGASATVAGAVGSAIVGAGLGAISAKVTGGDVKTGALLGGIGGGISGYAQAAKAATAASSGVPSQPATLGGANVTPAVASGPGATLGATPAAASSNTLAEAALQNASLGGSGAGLSTAGVTDAAAQTLGTKFMSGVKAAGSAVASAVTNPENLASITIQAGAQLIGAALAPDSDLSPEQKELIDLRKAELAALKEKDEKAFETQMEAAEMFLKQANQYNPVYMAYQAANKAAIDSQRKLREQERQYALASGRDLSPAERRRMQLDAARNVTSSYDQGYQQGLTAQNRVTQAGLSAIPGGDSYSAYANALAGLQTDVNAAEQAMATGKSTAAKNIADMFAGWDTTRPTTDDEEDAIKKTNELAESITKNNSGLNTKNAPKEINQGIVT